MDIYCLDFDEISDAQANDVSVVKHSHVICAYYLVSLSRRLIVI